MILLDNNFTKINIDNSLFGYLRNYYEQLINIQKEEEELVNSGLSRQKNKDVYNQKKEVYDKLKKEYSDVISNLINALDAKVKSLDSFNHQAFRNSDKEIANFWLKKDILDRKMENISSFLSKFPKLHENWIAKEQTLKENMQKNIDILKESNRNIDWIKLDNALSEQNLKSSGRFDSLDSDLFKMFIKIIDCEKDAIAYMRIVSEDLLFRNVSLTNANFENNMSCLIMIIDNLYVMFNNLIEPKEKIGYDLLKKNTNTLLDKSAVDFKNAVNWLLKVPKTNIKNLNQLEKRDFNMKIYDLCLSFIFKKNFALYDSNYSIYLNNVKSIHNLIESKDINKTKIKK